MKEPKITKPLSLLDDSTAFIGSEEREWLELTKNTFTKKETHQVTKPSTQQLLYQQLKTAKPSENLTTTTRGTKVFKNTKNLRQLMSEYNGRKTTLPPLKSSLQTQNSKPSNQSDFKYDRMEIMEVPSINGKILRPTTTKDKEKKSN